MTALALVLWPTDAHAWGPLAHLSFSSGALEALPQFSPWMRALVERFSSEFIYGSLAADIIVGKNLAKYAVHCHNWKVGLRVLDRSRGDAQKAFSLGFLAHLAADTVAHNYYVPYKTVEGHRQRAGHAYWELRYDQALPTNLWKLARHVSQRQYRAHDEHLEEVLEGSHVIPFSVSRQLFGSLLIAARLRKWQRLSSVLARKRDLLLHTEEVGENRKLAVGQIVSLLTHGETAQCIGADPTGERNLHFASDLSARLRKRDLPAEETARLVRRVRPAFRTAIHGRLALPELPHSVEQD